MVEHGPTWRIKGRAMARPGPMGAMPLVYCKGFRFKCSTCCGCQFHQFIKAIRLFADVLSYKIYCLTYCCF